MKEVYGIQLYSVRDVAEKDLRLTLRLVSEMGYRQVEFAGFFGHSADQVRSWLEEYHLEPIGTHIGLSDLAPEKIEETIAYHCAIGCRNLIVPAANWSTAEKRNANLEKLCRAQVRLAEEGLSLGYHNHSHELIPTDDGCVAMEEIISKTNVRLEPDVFWLFYAGVDPIAFCEAHKDRIDLIHLKDGMAAENPNRSHAEANKGDKGVSLGLGEVPIAALREWALANHVGMVVESESLSPSGPEEVERCINYLRSLEA